MPPAHLRDRQHMLELLPLPVTVSNEQRRELAGDGNHELGTSHDPENPDDGDNGQEHGQDRTGGIARLHWCVDHAWIQPPRTLMSCIEIASESDDRDLFHELAKKYASERGLLHLLFSWKTCTKIDFVKVSVTQ